MRRLLAGILGSVLAAGLLVGPVAADLLGPAWKARAPFTVTVGSTIADSELQAFTELAIADWSESSVLDMALGPRPNRGPYVTIQDGYWPDVWAGKAAISTDHGYITGVSIRLNRTWLDAASDTTRQRVICHELGHALGLDHQAGTDSCMFQGNTTAVSPNALDYADLETAY